MGTLRENQVSRMEGDFSLPSETLEIEMPVAETLSSTPQVWQRAIDALSARVAILDDEGRIIAINDAWHRFATDTGDGSDQVGVNYLRVCEAGIESGAAWLAPGLEVLLAGRCDRLELEYPCPEGATERWYVLRAVSYLDEGRLRVVVSHEDVSEQRRLRERVALQAALLNEIDAAVIATDATGTIVAWPGGAERLYGWSSEQAVGRSALDLLFPVGTVEDPVLQGLSAADQWSGEQVSVRRDGSTFEAFVSARTIGADDGKAAAIVGVALDLSERLEAERELMLMRDHLRAVTESIGDGLYAIDLEGRITYMNHVAEEKLGWTFEDLSGKVVHEIVHNRHADGSPFPAEECPVKRASVTGEVIRVDDDVFIRADGTHMPVAYTAAPFATDAGVEGCVVVFTDITERKARDERLERQVEELAWVKRIREALADDRFVLYAQPIVDIATRQIVQRELLLRMRGPGSAEEIIPPGVFLPVAEEYGFIGAIDRWVIDRSAEIAGSGVPVELNVSAASLSDPSLITHITDAIARTGADPTKMVFEITETTLVDAKTAGRTFVASLKEIGCQVALDDFGTGYGGFTYLKQLPIDYLKIDIEFVRDLTHNEASRTVVEAIVKLARGFGLKTVAEGVENELTMELLRELEVDYAQGFHISRPAEFVMPSSNGTLPADAIELDQRWVSA